MIDGLIRWSLQHRTIVVALAAAFLVWGGWTATRIPLDVLPDLTAPTVTILAEAPGMDPLEIESLVTFPIESALERRRGRSARALCDRCGRRGGVGGIRLGTGHPPRASDGDRETHARRRVRCRRTSSHRSSRRSPRSWARCSSSISNRTGTRRWSFGPSPRPSFGVGCSPFRACRR